MSTQIVRSYVRSNKYEPNEVPEESNIIGYILGAGAVLTLALVYWYITILVGLTAIALYGVKTIYLQPAPVVVAEAVTEAPKEKRHYQRRITVNHYQMNKSVRI